MLPSVRLGGVMRYRFHFRRFVVAIALICFSISGFSDSRLAWASESVEPTLNTKAVEAYTDPASASELDGDASISLSSPSDSQQNGDTPAALDSESVLNNNPDAASDAGVDDSTDTSEPQSGTTSSSVNAPQASSTPSAAETTASPSASIQESGAVDSAPSRANSTVFTSPSGKKTTKIVVTYDQKIVSSIHIGQSVVVSPLLTGYTEGKTEFNYVWEYEGWKSWWSTVKETGKRTTETSYAFTPSKAGTYTLYLDVISGGKTQTVSTKIRVEESWSYDSLVLSKSSISLGESVTVTPHILGVDSAFARFNYVWAYGAGWSEWSSTVRRTGTQTKDWRLR